MSAAGNSGSSSPTSVRAIVGGSANPLLSRALREALGVPETVCRVERFPDGELHVAIEEPLRGREATIVQPTSPPVGENLVELALLADACRRAGAPAITAVIPYFGYARQDRRKREGEPLGTRVACELLGGRFGRVIAVDVHGTAVESALDAPLDHVSAASLLAEALRRSGASVVVAPDLGASRLARRFGEWLDLPVAFVHKTRVSGSAVEVQGIVGEVRGLSPVIVDDMISTGGTIEAAARALREAGAASAPIVAVTHALLVGPAIERLRAANLARLVCSDSVPQEGELPFPREVVPLAPLLADVLRRIDGGRPLPEGLRSIR